MSSLGDLLAQLHHDPVVRGAQFESICKWFLENDPVYSHELRQVWLWKDWPGRWGADAGIDLVAEDRRGRLWAIQAKAYSQTTTVTKRDVDTFLAESGRSEFEFRLLIASTDLIGTTAKRTIESQQKPASVTLLGDLEASDANWPVSPEALQARKHRKKSAQSHQLEAVENIVKGFDTADRGQAVMACGTGKTLTALFVHERLKCTRTLVLVPSLSLMAQTIREWTTNANLDFEFLAVCSDDTVAEQDSFTSTTSDLGVPVTTDHLEIAEFLRAQSDPLVVFSTYQSSPQVAAALDIGTTQEFDLVVADEAHRCAGQASPCFGTVLDNAAIPSNRRLYMTATPRLLSDRAVKAAAAAQLEVSSMDDEAKFGPVFHRLSFGQAINRGLLTDYQMVIVAVDNGTYRQWANRGQFVKMDGEQITDASALASHIGVAKSIRKYGLRRTITFHSRVNRAREFSREFPRVVEWMPPYEAPQGAIVTDYVSGEMSAGQRRLRLRQLGAEGPHDYALLSNARCLTEGVDVPSLDGVAFIDPRGSEIDIVQAVGRAIRLSGSKTIGTIVIPVFVDPDKDPSETLRDSGFKQIWNVVRALRSHDEELGEYLDELRYELGRGTRRPKRPSKIRLDLPESISPDFASAFDVSMVEFTTASWEFWLGLLDRFYDENGHRCPTVSYKVDGYSLGEWVNTQRDRRVKGTLPLEREERLDRLAGWSWDPNADKWEEGFRHLLAFVEQNGHAAVPPRLVFNGYRLGQWTMVQRAFHAKARLDADRASRLARLEGWSFDPRSDRWDEGYSKLLRFVETNGDARVPSTCTIDAYNLGGWVKSQRRAYSAGKLSAARRERLERLDGWTWRATGDEWDEGFKRLVEHIAKNGDALVPASYVTDGYRLGAWVNAQRNAYAKQILDPDRIQQLDGISEWRWSGREASWEEGFAYLLDYVGQHGDAFVPTAYKHYDYPLGQWVATQRQFHSQGSLATDRAQRLEALTGWAWDARDAQWKNNLKLLIEFIAHEGHALVPKTYVTEGHRLGAWVGLQRRYYSKNELEPERVKQLESLPEWRWAAR